MKIKTELAEFEKFAALMPAPGAGCKSCQSEFGPMIDELKGKTTFAALSRYLKEVKGVMISESAIRAHWKNHVS